MVPSISALFLNTRKLTSSKEDHLTEFLAALITMSESFNLEFSSLMLGEYADRNGWVAPVINSVETQVSYPGTNCCPDMRFILEDGHVILCENKIEAPETQGSSSDPRGQLRRYLDLPSDGVIYIRATPSHGLEAEVTEHPRFVTRNGHHFLWRDIYQLLSGNPNPLVASVCKGFEVMGFVPPLPAVGTLSDFNSSEDEQNRSAFKELWQLAADYGRQLMWKVETNKNAELYYSPDASCPIYMIFVSPSKAERFLIRMTLREGASSADLLNKIEGVSTEVPYEVTSYQRMTSRGGQKVTENVIDITSSLRNVIGSTEDKGRIQQLLLEYVKGFVDAVAFEKYEPDTGGLSSSLVKQFENTTDVAATQNSQMIAELDRGAIIHFEDVTLDPVNHWVWRGGQKIDVTAKEYRLLLFMVQNANQILSREMINKNAFGEELDSSSNIIDVYVTYLRKKLESGFSEKLIHTVRGKGYMLKGSESYKLAQVCFCTDLATETHNFQTGGRVLPVHQNLAPHVSNDWQSSICNSNGNSLDSICEDEVKI